MTNASQQQQQQQQRQVTLVGYGKYGKLITNKYISTETPCQLATVIDPSFRKDNQQIEDFTLRTRQQTAVRAFDSFESWYNNYWMKLSDEERSLVVVDVAVKPDICYNVVSSFVQQCSEQLRWMILPKPIVETKDEIRGIVAMLNRTNIQAVVASQWAYSPLPTYIETKLKQHHSTTTPLSKIVLDFTKENGHSYGTHPPLLEVPHCLQLLHSTRVVNYHDPCSPSWPVERHVTGNGDCVIVRYVLANGLTVIVKSDLDYKPSPSERQQGANAARSDYQIRTMTAFDESGETALEADFWVHFDRKGKEVLREGSVVCHGQDHVHPVREDQLGNMIGQIFCDIKRSDDATKDSNCVLDVNTYQAIAEEIMDIEEEWKLHVNSATSSFEHKYQVTKRRPSLDLRTAVVSSQA